MLDERDSREPGPKQVELPYQREMGVGTQTRWWRWLIAVSVFACMHFPHRSEARDAARDLRRLTGYCIAATSWVEEVHTSSGGEKYLQLANGITFKVEMLLLDPLPLTDVIIFTKPMPQEWLDQMGGKVPDEYLYMFKLLIENEVFDAQPLVR